MAFVETYIKVETKLLMFWGVTRWRIVKTVGQFENTETGSSYMKDTEWKIEKN